MATDPNFERLEDYLEQRLSPEENQALQKELGQNSELRRALLEHRLAGRAVELSREDYLRAQLDGVRAKYGELPEPGGLVPMRRVLSWAAVALLLIVGASAIFLQRSYSDRALAREYYQLATTGNIAGADEQEAAFEEGLSAFYAEKNYPAAIDAFQKIQKESPLYPEAQYFLSHSFFQTRQYRESAARFEFLQQQTSLPAYVDPAELRWNLLLSRLAAGDSEEELLPVLDDLATSSETAPALREKALRLKRDLESFWR